MMRQIRKLAEDTHILKSEDNLHTLKIETNALRSVIIVLIYDLTTYQFLKLLNVNYYIAFPEIFTIWLTSVQ